MLPFVLRRLAWGVVLFLAVTLYTYVLFFVVAHDTVRVRRTAGRASELDVRDVLGLEGSVLHEYAGFVSRVVHLDFGESFVTGEPVTDVLRQAVPVTASLVAGGAAVWLALALAVGIASAYRPRSLLDRAGMVLVLVGLALHPVVIGYLLSYVVGYRLGVLPISGYCDVFGASTYCSGLGEWARHLVLPWTTFALTFAALYARMVRATVLEAMHEDYVRTARAKGLGEWAVVRRHVLRNALAPVLTMIAMDMAALAGLFTQAVFVERVFGLPGLGSQLFLALNRRDFPVLIAITVVVTTAVVVLTLVVDLLYGVLDPRARRLPPRRLPRLRVRGREPMPERPLVVRS